MSDTDNLAEENAIEEKEHSQTQPFIAKPLHRQFASKLAAIWLTVLITLALTFVLFYQKSEQSRILIEGELSPLKQQLEQVQALQKTKYIVNELLFVDSGANFVELQTELIVLNRQLLRLESSNTHLYQQWLNANKLANDIVMRIQQSHSRNEQLKQSSIIQLQLMWFSITPIINKKIAQQELLFEQLKADHINDKLTFSRANAYVSAVEKSHNLQQLKSLLAEVLSGFEQLTIHTSIEDFDLLRLGVEQIFAQRNMLKVAGQTKAMLDFNQQIDTFEEIVLTHGRALAKWQGYIRLSQSYQLDLTMQNTQLLQILAEPQTLITTHVPTLLDHWRINYNIHLTQEELSVLLLFLISVSLVVFCYLLWRLREQIKVAAQHSVVLIHKSIRAENTEEIQANCAETQEIIQQVRSIAKPIHNEQEFQKLQQQCQDYQGVIAEQTQSLAAHTQSTNQQQLNTSEQVACNLNGELQRYQHLEHKLLALLQQQQARLLDKSVNNKAHEVAQLSLLTPIYEQLKQFYLTSDIRSEKTVLSLIDVNLVNELHAILLNKQNEYQINNNQLYFSYDELILPQVKLDFRLFKQLMNMLIDITLVNCRDAQLHLHLQLQDKSSGQQLVHFVVTLITGVMDGLPSDIQSLIEPQTADSKTSPLVEMFNVIFTKQYGENIVAHQTDDGVQLSFELPLAIAASGVVNKTAENKLEGTKVMLLSGNNMQVNLVENIVHSAAGKCEVLADIESFTQQLTENNLNKHKLDLLIITSDFAQTNLNNITQTLKHLPALLQPKLLVLQSLTLEFERFGCYSQSEELLCKEGFLHNVKELLTSEASSNQLCTADQYQKTDYLESRLPILLAVNSPQHYHNFQRQLRWLGLQVHVVSHEYAQRELWKTGLYSVLITEFPESSLLEMTSKPLVDIAVFSLTDNIPRFDLAIEIKDHVEHWQIGQLTQQSTLDELKKALSPWLQEIKLADDTVAPSGALSVDFIEDDEDKDDTIIKELVTALDEEEKSAVFDFSKYLRHQGSVELALFMLEDYGQDNHQQLNTLLEAIKEKDIIKAQEANNNMQFNAKVLAATELEQLCSQWSKLLNGNEIPTSLNEVNTLFKKTRTALIAIDNYAESI